MSTTAAIEQEAKALYEDFAAASDRGAPAWAQLSKADKEIWHVVARGVLRRHAGSIGGPSDPDPPRKPGV